MLLFFKLFAKSVSTEDFPHKTKLHEPTQSIAKNKQNRKESFNLFITLLTEIVLEHNCINRISFCRFDQSIATTKPLASSFKTKRRIVFQLKMVRTCDGERSTPRLCRERNHRRRDETQQLHKRAYTEKRRFRTEKTRRCLPKGR